MSWHATNHAHGLFPPPLRGRVREGDESHARCLPFTPLPTASRSTSPARGEVTRGETVPEVCEMLA